MKWSLSDFGGGSGRLHDRQTRIRAFLKQHPVGVLSSVDPNGNPHGVVVYFVIDDQFVIRLLTRRGTRKQDNLLHYNHVMLTVYDTPSQVTVQVTGLAFERADVATVTALRRQIGTLARRLSPVPSPAEQFPSRELTSFLIEPVQIRMANYGSSAADNSLERFDTIETFSPL